MDWEVETVGLRTDEEPSSRVETRFAIVRKDRPKGHSERVVGVVHKDFKPLQNREGIRIFDSIFGRGKRVYHTGWYLGSGEVVWLLVELPRKIRVLEGDEVVPYALFTNGHNGSIAIDFRLTTVRVVCQNTLSLALNDDVRKTVFIHRLRRLHGFISNQSESEQKKSHAAGTPPKVPQYDLPDLRTG